MNTTYRFRLYPNKTQERTLNTMMFHSKRLYNVARIHRIYLYEATGKSISWQEQSRFWVTECRKLDYGFAMLPYDTASYVIQRLGKAYDAFFRRVKNGEKPGFPKRMKYCSTLEFKYPSGIKFMPVRVDKKKAIQEVYNSSSWTKLYVMNVGEIRVRCHRDLPNEGKISYAAITKSPQSGHWHMQLVVNDGEPYPKKIEQLRGALELITPYRPDMKCVGIDIGLVHAFTLSDETLENPFIEPEQHYQSKLRELRILQRKLSRQRRANNPDCYDDKGRSIKGKRQTNKSNRMKKTQAELKRLHFQVAEARKEWLHAFTKWLTDEYDFIAIEDLSPKFMIQNGRLALRALDISFSMFRSMLEYKCWQTETILVAVPPQYTSQTCIRCGNIDPANRKTQSKFECTMCGYQNNADVLGSKNILTRALMSYT